jgi:hypothetical protein
VALAIVLACVGVILVLLPEVARRLVVNRLEERLGAPVHIDDLDLNPSTRRGEVSGLVAGH